MQISQFIIVLLSVMFLTSLFAKQVKKHFNLETSPIAYMIVVTPFDEVFLFMLGSLSMIFRKYKFEILLIIITALFIIYGKLMGFAQALMYIFVFIMGSFFSILISNLVKPWKE